ncbi:MAG: hypothetical protein IAE98_03850 [Candidatus Kapabacteria bacterium]|nr:hypothetical protein [Candidatus Kapabacteria bacterium]
MEFLIEVFNNNTVLFGLVGLLVVCFIGIMLLQWIADKTGVNTDKLQEELKKTAEDAQVETAKELKKTVEKITDGGQVESAPKNKYALRDETGKFVKADTEIGGTTEKRKVGRPRKVQK